MPRKKTDTPERAVKRKYEKAHRKEREERRGQFNTTILRTELEEINEFLKDNGYSKRLLICEGYAALKEIKEGIREPKERYFEDVGQNN